MFIGVTYSEHYAMTFSRVAATATDHLARDRWSTIHGEFKSFKVNVGSNIMLHTPVSEFKCVQGHYVLKLDSILTIYITDTSLKAAKYSKRQLLGARAGYNFIIRMGFISYKAAAEVVRRGSISNLLYSGRTSMARQRHINEVRPSTASRVS